MNRAVVLAICGMTLAACAQANPLCDVAEAGLQRFAQARGLAADMRCRASVGQPLPADASLSAMDWPKGQVPRSGALTWPVRVQVGQGRSYVQQVPLSVAWTAPAWVGVRNLEPGAELQPGDLELQSRRWPEGMAVQAADAQAQPQGRLRSAVRAGDILTAAALLPAGALVRGDRVTAVLAQGAMEIRMPAQLLAPSRVGEVARAQATGRTTPLEGRLVDAKTLMVVSE
ncbi:flagella basal body P-ring formation protein FlgA [Roseateles sp. P5_E11]